jgi:PKD repeat protein
VGWLTETPAGGGVLPGQTLSVTVSFDTSWLVDGVYTTTLHLASNDADEPLLEIPVTLTVFNLCAPPRDLAFSWEPSIPVVDQLATFTASVTGTQPITLTWDFGDNTTGAGLAATHAFTQPDTYTVTLTAENPCSTTSIAHSVIVTSEPCTPPGTLDFSWLPLSPEINQPVTFTASVTGTQPITLTWDFGDELTATGEVVTHTFTQPGTYTVTLTAENACGVESITHLLIIDPTVPPDTFVIYLPLVSCSIQNHR